MHMERLQSRGEFPQLDNDSNEWAILCKWHHDEIEAAISSNPFNPKMLLRAWIKAQGGAKSAAERTLIGRDERPRNIK